MKVLAGQAIRSPAPGSAREEWRRIAEAALAADPSLLALSFLDPLGNPLAGAGRNASRHPPQAATLLVSIPLEGQPVTLQATVSLAREESLRQATLRQGFLLALLIAALAALGAGIALHRYLRPLAALPAGNMELADLARSVSQAMEHATGRNQELTRQAAARKQAESQLEWAKRRLAAVSRRSGVAEVATNVLHNVGNVLTSLNVSADLLTDKLRDSRVNKLPLLTDMLIDHSADLERFLREDPKGQRLLPYLSNLGRHFKQERQSMLLEVEQLRKHVGHIRDIVDTQQSYARVPAGLGPVDLRQTMEDAVRIAAPGLESAGIVIAREYQPVPLLLTQRNQVLHILLNLLRNARQAVESCPEARPPRIHLGIRLHGEDRVRLQVRDNGIGLSARHLTLLFSHGFTTKQDGHGFGLHSGAASARQLGGALWAESEGPGRGAVFTLELPLKFTAPEEGASHGLAELE
ncbi:MAG: HAMP domain-containing histidine kinase [Bryobacterales bacterium]|nr:HAMP domain-containing histidine kinase [Bryobacterales bacterium]